MTSASPVPPGTMSQRIEALTRSALDRLAADIPIAGIDVGHGELPVDGRNPRAGMKPAPRVCLLVDAPGLLDTELLYWFSYTLWGITQEQADSVVREEMLKLRRSLAELAGVPAAPRPAQKLPPGLAAGSRLFLPPGAPAGQG